MVCILASINSILFRSLDTFTIFIFILFKTINQTPSTAFWVTRFLEHKIAVDFSANHRGQHCSWFYHLRNLIQEESVSFLKNFIRYEILVENLFCWSINGKIIWIATSRLTTHSSCFERKDLLYLFHHY